MSAKFDMLWSKYPEGDQNAFFHRLGGGWPQLIGEPSFENTCALRMTVTLRACGEAPPLHLVIADGNLRDGAQNGLIIRVISMKAWLEGIVGKSSWGMSKAIGADIEPNLPDKTGILMYRVPNASDASGHVDLWNGTGCRNDCHSKFARSATEVELWFLE